MSKELIKKFFGKEKIEYFAVLDYRSVRESAPEIMERESFTPRSVIVFLMPYYTGEGINLSSYAVSLDYHIALRGVCRRLAEALATAYPNMHARAYGDHSPIDERHAAVIGGLGVFGDSGLIINEKYGTYVFIGDLVTDIDPSALGAMEPTEPRGCIHCGACEAACPTGVLRGSGEDCLSALTQKKGALTEREESYIRLGGYVFGCDECQRACPYNRAPKMTPVPFFYRERIPALSREILDGMGREELSRRAFGWRGRRLLERNLEILK
ncbi:MAG: epoxyqueuosine reductase [Clostridia bacterium]|nr:epoxyqueuosine reductase [Clostridia bacterium]